MKGFTLDETLRYGWCDSCLCASSPDCPTGRFKEFPAIRGNRSPAELPDYQGSVSCLSGGELHASLAQATTGPCMIKTAIAPGVGIEGRRYPAVFIVAVSFPPPRQKVSPRTFSRSPRNQVDVPNLPRLPPFSLVFLMILKGRLYPLLYLLYPNRRGKIRGNDLLYHLLYPFVPWQGTKVP